VAKAGNGYSGNGYEQDAMRNRKNKMGLLAAVYLFAILECANPSAAEWDNDPVNHLPANAGQGSYEKIQAYISSGWDTLTRSLDQCKTFEDMKTDTEPTLYLPAEIPEPAALVQLVKARCRVDVRSLPDSISKHGQLDSSQTKPEGLLYLERPYVVPGGQFNEMYGWDSYFIIRGLLLAGRLDLAKGMVENFFFEIEHYGAVLNANRTYYLSRSQPPFLGSMVLAVYEAEGQANRQDPAWLQRAYDFVAQDYRQWINPPHLAGDTGLSRYFDHGEGPVPEIIGDPNSYYRGVAQFFAVHGGSNQKYLIHVDGSHTDVKVVGPVFTLPGPCTGAAEHSTNDDCQTTKVALAAEFYKGDRSMRESGFDVSFRFGPFSADTHHYAPICLNSLLYKTEKDLEHISTLLGKADDAKKWSDRAALRRQNINKYLWDQERGQYFDYDFTTHTRSTYEYATTFYPLWTALASSDQAHAIMKNLNRFENPGGLAMSRVESQAQWDFPYGWAPIHLLACEGMRRYGYNQDADRISYNFLTMVIENFERDHTIREKYDVASRTSVTHIAEGYAQNVVGFGWTNATFLVLADGLPPKTIERLKLQ
jgi:alpha,alpha-trehalase